MNCSREANVPKRLIHWVAEQEWSEKKRSTFLRQSSTPVTEKPENSESLTELPNKESSGWESFVTSRSSMLVLVPGSREEFFVRPSCTDPLWVIELANHPLIARSLLPLNVANPPKEPTLKWRLVGLSRDRNKVLEIERSGPRKRNVGIFSSPGEPEYGNKHPARPGISSNLPDRWKRELSWSENWVDGFHLEFHLFDESVQGTYVEHWPQLLKLWVPQKGDCKIFSSLQFSLILLPFCSEESGVSVNGGFSLKGTEHPF